VRGKSPDEKRNEDNVLQICRCPNPDGVYLGSSLSPKNEDLLNPEIVDMAWEYGIYIPALYLWFLGLMFSKSALEMDVWNSEMEIFVFRY